MAWSSSCGSSMSAPCEWSGPAGADDVGARLAVLASAAPGLDTIAEASAIDPQTLEPGALLDQLVTVERAQRWLAACQHDILAAIDAAPSLAADVGAELEADIVRSEVGSALALHPIT